MKKKKFLIFTLAHKTISSHKQSHKQWHNFESKSHYDVIIVGGGGHGLATAFYLAKKHNINNIAVLEKNWIASGNTRRNTTIIHSNYLDKESIGIYDKVIKLWQNLSQDLKLQCYVFSTWGYDPCT